MELPIAEDLIIPLSRKWFNNYQNSIYTFLGSYLLYIHIGREIVSEMKGRNTRRQRILWTMKINFLLLGP